METESITEQIKNLCFNQNLNEIYSHDFMIDKLANMLRNNRCSVNFEYPLNLVSGITVRTGKRITYGGLIDLMAFRNSQSIAIEFDNGFRLKFKSIEKLLCSDAKILIGIVKGNRNSPELLDENKLRIVSRMKELYIVNKKILLIMMSEKIATNVSL